MDRKPRGGERLPQYSQVVHRRGDGGRPGGRGRRPEPGGGGLGRLLGLGALLLVACGVSGYLLTSGANLPWTEWFVGVAAQPGAATQDPFITLGGFSTSTPEPPPPTIEYLPPPTPTPLSAAAIASSDASNYVSQSGDTLSAVAARYGVNPADIRASDSALAVTTTLPEGQLLVVPQILDAATLGPAAHVLPDSEVIFGPSATDIDPQATTEQLGGYLSRYRGYTEDLTLKGGDLVFRIARQHSINPRVLLTILEYHGGWVSQATPTAEGLARPMGYSHTYKDNLAPQLNWVSNQLSIGYYNWRAGALTTLTFKDGSTLRMNPGLNAGTAALQYLYSQMGDRATMEAALGADGLVAAYTRLFGAPETWAVRNLIPGDLQQPALALPFRPNRIWSFTGGPHPAWISSGQWAAIDFAPSSSGAGCGESFEPVVASAGGVIVRADHNAVVLDLDGDGRETTGWTVFYFHIRAKGMIAVGTVVELGDVLGYPSCEGGRSTGTHVHLARKYNGEWMPVNGIVPFNLSGWVVAIGRAEYQGTLTRDGAIVEACTCSAPYTAISREP
ncbi:MAG: LysM peptidoglycan-binding domain-containing M23 family metallopeptidase [Anaerolineales bacterium]|nr:LysM peptidoglycan-binding domain-containing M23 family metallopeptidase [Anaerolineales bacterium]